MIGARVDFFASEGHFLDHLAPIWHALPDHRRGQFFVAEPYLPRAVAAGVAAAVAPEHRAPLPPPPGRVVVVASIGDFRRVQPRPTVLAEHGAGQSYGNRHPSYAGGIGRGSAVLFLVPNAYAARRNRARYPRIPNAIVGCPKLDDLMATAPPPGPPTAVVSFHWRCRVVPETNTALDHFADVLADAHDELERAGVVLLGHAHPRIADEAREVYDAAGIDVVNDFADVLRVAHVYAVDNSSTLFEFAAAGRPVVVLNAPTYRRGVNFGLRFWDAATVGPNVDHPEDLAPAILRALDDPEDLARSREAALARVYPVRDGTSAARAAKAVLDVVAPHRCPVCSADRCKCGPPTTVVGVDERIPRRSASVGPLKRYRNPEGRGYLRLTEADARRLGLEPHEDAPTPAPPAILSSDRTGRPTGAIAPGGPTSRARTTANADGPDAGDDPGGDGAPEDKKRPAPSTRRRRRATTTPED